MSSAYSISSIDLGVIQEKAKTLHEKYYSELVHAKLPEELEINLISVWDQYFSTKQFSLKKRLDLFKTEKEIKHNKLDFEWISVFQDISALYFNYKTVKNKSILRTNQKIPFEKVLLPFVVYAHSSLEKEYPISKKWLSKKVLKSHLELLLRKLSNIAGQSLFKDLKNLKRNENSSELGISKYEYYSELFFSGYAATFFKEYCALTRLLVSQLMLWLHSTGNFLNNLENDHQDISDYFFNGMKLDKIEKLSSDFGPSHSFDGPNRIITFKSGIKIVYKTKSAITDVFYNSLIDWINEKDVNISLQGFGVIDKGEYSWHEYIPYESCQSKKEVKLFYYRLGYLTAVLQVLGSKDYHYGNILANGEQPILIDNETILNPFAKENSFDIRNANVVASQNKTSKGKFNNLLGAFNYKVAVRVKVVKVMKGNKIQCFNKKKFWIGKNIPKLKQKRVNPTEYKTQIQHGYVNGLNILMEHHKSLNDFIETQLVGLNFNYRYLFRPSLEYLQLLLDSLQPSYLRTGLERSIYFEQLFQKTKYGQSDSFTLDTISKELKHMQNFYWPRFIFGIKEWKKMGLDTTKYHLPELKIMKQIKNNLHKLQFPEGITQQAQILRNHLQLY